LALDWKYEYADSFQTIHKVTTRHVIKSQMKHPYNVQVTTHIHHDEQKKLTTHPIHPDNTPETHINRWHDAYWAMHDGSSDDQ